MTKTKKKAPKSSPKVTKIALPSKKVLAKGAKGKVKVEAKVNSKLDSKLDTKLVSKISIKQQAKGLVAGLAKKAQKLLTPPKSTGKPGKAAKVVKVAAKSKPAVKLETTTTIVAPQKASQVVVQTSVVAVKGKRRGKGTLPITQLSNIGRSGKGPDMMMSKKSLNDAVCREVACEGLATTSGYCRLHYIKNWKKIKRKELILKERKLNQYIEELVTKYPDKYIEAIRQDLSNDKDFAKVIYDLELDESIDDFDGEGGDSDEAIIDSIKRDFDDEGDTF